MQLEHMRLAQEEFWILDFGLKDLRVSNFRSQIPDSQSANLKSKIQN
jgi:hypothetical protein